ncbi:MAG: hypothetical protein AUH92_03245 [Acidobacteria bacterium 13_1_40CM_4_69_4]|nr:MAG: hypothetical protein AUH92_03245 [Acidobacteria bacterium 13_1_40CM_4_69_4]
MSPAWTHRGSPSPPASGTRSARLAAALAALLLLAASAPACGRSKNENRIKPIIASMSIDPFTGTPNPAVYLEKVKTTGDLVTVSVKLHTSSTIDFDAFTLEFDYDPTLVQVSDAFEINSTLLGDCCLPGDANCSPCQPLCEFNAVAANTNGNLLIGVASRTNLSTGQPCQTATVSSAPTIDPPGTRIKLISGAGTGDCEILNALADLGIPCVDGNATMTASR